MPDENKTRVSKLSVLTGWWVFSWALKNISSDIKSNTTELSRLYEAGVGKEDTTRSSDLSQIKDPQERFEVVASAEGCSAEALYSIARNALISCYLSWLVALVCVVEISRELVLGGSWLSQATAVILGVPCFCLSVCKAIQQGLYYYQVTHRSLIDLKSYLRMSGRWIPSERGLKGLKVSAVALLMLTSFGHAMAADSTSSVFGSVFTDPTTTDLWARSLSYIFPHIGPLSSFSSTANAAGLTGLSSAMTIMLDLLMGCGMAMLVWQIIKGMVATAHEGKILGSKTHSVWAPLRILYGIGILAPSVNGFCMAQVLVIYLSVWSGQAASLIWYTYVDSLTSVSASLLNGYTNDTETAFDFATAEICYWTVSDLDSANGYGSSSELTTHPTGTQGEATTGISDKMVLSNSSGYTTIDSHYYNWDYGFCGHISGAFTDVSNDSNAQVYAFDKARLSATRSLQSSISSVAKTIAATATMTSSSTANLTASELTKDAAQVVQAVEKANSAYNEAMSEAATTLSTSLASSSNDDKSDLATNAKTYGWMTAGAYYMDISRLQTVAYNVDARKVKMTQGETYPGAAGPDWNKISNPKTGSIGFVYNQLTDLRKSLDESDYSSALTSKTVQTGVGSNEKDGGLSGLMSGIVRGITGALVGMTTGGTTASEPGTTGVLQGMVNFGHKILFLSESLFLLAMMSEFWASQSWWKKGLTVAAEAVTEGPVAAVGQSLLVSTMSNLGATALGYLMMLALGMMTIGIMYAYILPMVPFLMFTMFIMHNLVIVAEAVVATPLWAYSHIRSDGGEFADGKMAGGYNMLFNLFLRIPLGICGLIMSMGVFESASWMFDQLYIPAVQSAISDTWSGVMAIVTMTFIAGYVHFHLAVSSFGLMSAMPAKAAQWMGVSGDQRDESNDTMKVHGAAVNIVARGSAGKAGDALKMKKDAENAKAKAKGPTQGQGSVGDSGPPDGNQTPIPGIDDYGGDEDEDFENMGRRDPQD